MIKKSLILKSGLAVGLSIGLSLGFISPNDYAYAIEEEKTESVANSSGKIVQLNENLARIDLEDDVTYDIKENNPDTFTSDEVGAGGVGGGIVANNILQNDSYKGDHNYEK